ncbi:MAG: helix-turn-helix domain-containing protein [Puniceicoccales bacterium]|jgi:excisionase family DNA binding protein|nr:helix-turn-helix domain-containing protein [Puniceicoccales bacterium]
MEKIPSQNKLLNTEEVAEILGIKPQTLSVWISTKRYPIRSLKIGRLRKFRREDVDAFMEGCESTCDCTTELRTRKSKKRKFGSGKMDQPGPILSTGGGKDGL